MLDSIFIPFYGWFYVVRLYTPNVERSFWENLRPMNKLTNKARIFKETAAEKSRKSTRKRPTFSIRCVIELLKSVAAISELLKFWWPNFGQITEPYLLVASCSQRLSVYFRPKIFRVILGQNWESNYDSYISYNYNIIFD